MELNLEVEGNSPQEVIAKLMQYLLAATQDASAEGLETAAASVPGVTANAGGGGGP